MNMTKTRLMTPQEIADAIVAQAKALGENGYRIHKDTIKEYSGDRSRLATSIARAIDKEMRKKGWYLTFVKDGWYHVRPLDRRPQTIIDAF